LLCLGQIGRPVRVRNVAREVRFEN
jgi:hypothetical protein